MRRITITLAAALLALPLAAQQTDTDKGLSLMEQGARLLMQSLLDEMEPALSELQAELGVALGELQPAVRELLALIDDFRNYEPPEKLPNGDIIIRRRVVPPLGPGTETEL